MLLVYSLLKPKSIRHFMSFCKGNINQYENTLKDSQGTYSVRGSKHRLLKPQRKFPVRKSTAVSLIFIQIGQLGMYRFCAICRTFIAFISQEFWWICWSSVNDRFPILQIAWVTLWNVFCQVSFFYLNFKRRIVYCPRIY